MIGFTYDRLLRNSLPTPQHSDFHWNFFAPPKWLICVSLPLSLIACFHWVCKWVAHVVLWKIVVKCIETIRLHTYFAAPYWWLSDAYRDFAWNGMILCRHRPPVAWVCLCSFRAFALLKGFPALDMPGYLEMALWNAVFSLLGFAFASQSVCYAGCTLSVHGIPSSIFSL